MGTDVLIYVKQNLDGTAQNSPAYLFVVIKSKHHQKNVTMEIKPILMDAIKAAKLRAGGLAQTVPAPLNVEIQLLPEKRNVMTGISQLTMIVIMNAKRFLLKNR